MDIDALHSALLSLTLLSENIGSARGNILKANAGEPCALGKMLEGMECDLRVAKATLARGVGLPVCTCCWPPELLAVSRAGDAICPSSSGLTPALKKRVTLPTCADRKGVGRDRRVAFSRRIPLSMSLSALTVVLITPLLWLAFGPATQAQDPMCSVCHKRTTTLTFSCANSEYTRHLDHGDTMGPCAVTPTENP